jgi:hypothetical protein
MKKKIFVLTVAVLSILQLWARDFITIEYTINDSAPKFTFDATHKPYKYAMLHYDNKGYSLSSSKAGYNAGIAVAVLDFAGKKIHTGMKTTTSKKAQDEYGTAYWKTYLSGRPVSSNSYVSFLAILNYKGQSYQSVWGKRLTDKAIMEKAHNTISKSVSVTNFIKKNTFEEDGPVSLSKEKLVLYTLDIPGLEATIACYKGDEYMLAQLPYVMTVIIINGKAYPIAGNCSNIHDVYKLGENYFIRSDWEPCNQDESRAAIYEIRPTGLVKEVDF